MVNREDARGPVVSTPRDDVVIRKQVPVSRASALSFCPFGVRSEATNKGVGELRRSQARVSAEMFGRTGVSLLPIRQKARGPETWADALLWSDNGEGGVVRTSMATNA